MSDQKKTKRRDFIVTASYALGAVGIGAAVLPLIDQMNPDASVKALSSTEVDLSEVSPGQSITVLWRGNAFWVEGMEGNAKIPGGGGGKAPLGTPPLLPYSHDCLSQLDIH